jgi:hypothetical protein
MLMLQVYVDETESFGSPPVFILAGYVAPAEQWARFSDGWQSALEMPPRVACFKVRDALRQRGAFYGWSKARCDERIALFRGLIERFVTAEIAVAFRTDHFRRVFGSWAGRSKDPYFFANANLPPILVRALDALGLPREPIDFIFDNKVMHKDRVMMGWEQANKAPLQTNPLDLGRILLNPPTFRDDATVLPLQAADMHATMMRLSFEAQAAGREPPTVPGFKNFLPGLLHQWNEAQLHEAAEQIIAYLDSVKEP